MRALRSYGLPLLSFGLPAGLIIGLFGGILSGWASDALVLGLIGGAVAGGLFALAIGTLDLVGDREARPGERSGPRQTASIQVRGGPDLPDRIETALLALGGEMRAVDVTAGRYRLRTKWTWRSFGEEVSVQLEGDPLSPIANVSSRPIVRSTLLDYGKGRQNVHRVVDALKQ